MKVSITTFLHMSPPRYGAKEPKFEFYPFDMSSNGSALVGERVIEVEVPDDFDPKPGLVKAMRKKQSDLRAESEFKIKQIEEHIQSLLAIEFKPAKV
jgi:hypothetical protein